MARWCRTDAADTETVQEARICQQGIAIRLAEVDPAQVALGLEGEERMLHAGKASCTVQLPIRFPLRGGSKHLRNGAHPPCLPDPTLIAALRRAHRMLERERGLPTMSAAPASPYDRSILRLAFLAPAIQREILAGRQPADLTLERFKRIAVPLAWSEQPAALRFTDLPIA